MLVLGRSLCQPSGAFNFSSLCCPADAGAAAGVPLFDTTTGAEPQPFATTAAINTAQVFRKLDWSMINDRLLQITRKKLSALRQASYGTREDAFNHRLKV